MGAAGIDKVKLIGYWHPNNASVLGAQLTKGFKEKYKDDLSSVSTYSLIASLSKAVKKAGTIDPVKVAFALEDTQIDFFGNPASMRKSDHQLQQTLYLSNWVKLNGKDVLFDQENLGMGWQTLQKIDAFVAAQPTSCQMKRP
jgi:branched-chain amino acid transport system substrate-binding protein